MPNGLWAAADTLKPKDNSSKDNCFENWDVTKENQFRSSAIILVCKYRENREQNSEYPKRNIEIIYANWFRLALPHCPRFQLAVMVSPVEF